MSRSVTQAGPPGSGGGRRWPFWRAGAVLAALETVRDPELDEPITSLGFVASCTVSADGEAEVRLRLPTYFCAPNFAYLMVADAYDAVSAVAGVRRACVVLEDHFASDAINGGVAAQAGFVRSFDGEAVAELDQLRADFLRKAVMAGTDQVLPAIAGPGRGPGGTARDDARAGAAVGRCGAAAGAPGRARPARRRRRPAGDRPGRGRRRWVWMTCRCTCGGPGLTRISIEANSGICRGMLRQRYETRGQGETN